ncbi:MAG TPA: hypothetical protein VGR28_15035 [Candidatus Thermoplasmatota archaeon]|jgi:hypothetical protein|nr:hypothetical protein [Candidatus Thermoplasmatota archaeon]
MRALPAVALAAALLSLAASGAAEPTERLAVRAGYPLPGGGAAVVVYDDPGCTTHQALWQGWLSAMDVAGYAWNTWAGFPSDGVDRGLDRAGQEGQALSERAAASAMNAQAQLPGWLAEPGLGIQWAWAQMGNEDLCVLGLGAVSTGL